MKKAIIAILSAVLVITTINSAQAEDQRVLAIIDTAIDSTKFSSIIYEACFTQNNSCPNKTNFMEGAGSASAVVWAKSISDGIYHGDSMVKAALSVNPNVKIVFVRFTNVSSIGNSALGNRPESLIAAIDWVSKNAEKYSIDAVSISQSGVVNKDFIALEILNPLCSDVLTSNAVSKLSIKNIPVFAATGNDKLQSVVGFPACVNNVIGVGALASETFLETATNSGPGLDLVAFGKISITKINGWQFDLAGSSGATATSASKYVKNNTSKTFKEYFSALPKISVNQLVNKILVNKGFYIFN